MAPVCEYRNTTNEHKEQIKLAAKTTFFLTTNAPAKLKVTPVAATPSNLIIIKSAAIEAFPVSFHAITENKKTSNHRATLVRKPARNNIVKVLDFQILNKTGIFIEKNGDQPLKSKSSLSVFEPKLSSYFTGIVELITFPRLITNSLAGLSLIASIGSLHCKTTKSPFDPLFIP